ncbi:single-stranded-DNA-specific exonuclease RecJ [Luteimonas yindakuii]|uniref:single-stranded-DNA-specific exonuclease RecJ n=1 Tax=Luteimonas yindakuii TaxID=2565782 RepID=UPI0010A46FE3|nr:single-stranded-DNA-specific exonuclease RecJ [Luteimonas yindakuii]QCO67738.1 single-stranded-DNA-specific exonuclease RecJ [Luteimonas yindakuii]
MTPLRRIRRRPAGASGAWPDHVLPLLRRVYAARGVSDFTAARPRLADLHAPDTLTGIAEAARLLADAIAAGRRIVVVGDFDCDGATACAVAVRGLRMLGAREVLHAVPNRIVHGYGLSPGLVDELAALGPELLVTVDHGIACHAGIAAAKARGWRVLVTDHHLPGPTLPAADVIVDPNLPGDVFPSKTLAGVGVIFYVLLALRGVLRARGAFDGAGPDLRVLLDLVAVGTVADLVALDANNRALVAAGLQRLRAGQGCSGLQALARVAGRDVSRLTAADIGYAIGPRLNAAGRLEDMSIGIECLLTDDPARALELAQLLDRINAERRGVQQTMVDEAEAALAGRALDAMATADDPAVCLFDPEWHPGVVGLVASKLKERLHRPVVAFAPAEPGSRQLRGSARSIPGFHIRDALAAVDAAHPGLIGRFGGHAMAAGLSLDVDALADFERAFRAHAARTLDAALLHAVIDSDGELAPHEFDHAHAEALRDGGPWGQAFPEPLFDGSFELLDARCVGQRHLRLRLRIPDRREPVDAIHFGGWDARPQASRVHLAYRLAPDDYRGNGAVQLVVEHLEPA